MIILEYLDVRLPLGECPPDALHSKQRTVVIACDGCNPSLIGLHKGVVRIVDSTATGGTFYGRLFDLFDRPIVSVDWKSF